MTRARRRKAVEDKHVQLRFEVGEAERRVLVAMAEERDVSLSSIAREVLVESLGGLDRFDPDAPVSGPLARQIYAWVLPATRRDLERVARRHGKAMSWVFRQGMSTYLSDRGRLPREATMQQPEQRPKQRTTKAVPVRLPKTLLDALRTRANEEDTTMSRLVMAACVRYVSAKLEPSPWPKADGPSKSTSTTFFMPFPTSYRIETDAERRGISRNRLIRDALEWEVSTWDVDTEAVGT